MVTRSGAHRFANAIGSYFNFIPSHLFFLLCYTHTHVHKPSYASESCISQLYFLLGLRFGRAPGAQIWQLAEEFTSFGPRARRLGLQKIGPRESSRASPRTGTQNSGRKTQKQKQITVPVGLLADSFAHTVCSGIGTDAVRYVGAGFCEFLPVNLCISNC